MYVKLEKVPSKCLFLIDKSIFSNKLVNLRPPLTSLAPSPHLSTPPPIRLALRTKVPSSHPLRT